MHMRKKKKAKDWLGWRFLCCPALPRGCCMYIEFLGALALPMKSSLHFT
jgi:hypothetical protein